MPYLSRANLAEAARVVHEMALCYSTKQRGELIVDRLLFGYLRGAGHTVERQVRVKSANAMRRIDFIAGGARSGAFVELVVRLKGEEWRRPVNSSELNKLCRVAGSQRSLIIVDISGKTPLTKAKLREEYKTWKSTPGNYKRRNVSVVYSAGPSHTFAFGIKVGKTAVAIQD